MFSFFILDDLPRSSQEYFLNLSTLLQPANHFCPPPLSGDPGVCFLRDRVPLCINCIPSPLLRLFFYNLTFPLPRFYLIWQQTASYLFFFFLGPRLSLMLIFPKVIVLAHSCTNELCGIILCTYWSHIYINSSFVNPDKFSHLLYWKIYFWRLHQWEVMTSNFFP